MVPQHKRPPPPFVKAAGCWAGKEGGRSLPGLETGTVWGGARGVQAAVQVWFARVRVCLCVILDSQD